MKKSFLSILFLAICFFVFSQEIYEKTVVDEPCELKSIVFRLAEEEYLNDEVESKRPSIIGTNIENGCDSVDCNIDHISVYFNKPMQTGNCGVSNNGQLNFPETGKWEWKSDKEYVIYVILQPDTKYSMVFHSFSTPEGYYMARPYILNFKTKKTQYSDCEREDLRPSIIGSSIQNGSNNVDYNLDHVSVYFDKPMLTDNSGAGFVEGQNYPEIGVNGKEQEWKSDKEWVVYFKLKPDTKYTMVFHSQFFKDITNFFYLKNTYTLTFKTGKKKK
jgi:hypothetical protein